MRHISPKYTAPSKKETRGSRAPPAEGGNSNWEGAQIALEGAKITESTWKWPWTSISEGAKIVGLPDIYISPTVIKEYWILASK